jgi:hypothetical protein
MNSDMTVLKKDYAPKDIEPYLRPAIRWVCGCAGKPDREGK